MTQKEITQNAYTTIIELLDDVYPQYLDDVELQRLKSALNNTQLEILEEQDRRTTK